jgi:ATP-dependent DNA ligase
MEARSEPELPEGAGWWFEPKWDGFRCLAIREDDDLILQAKSGKSLTRFFPEVAAAFAALPFQRFVVDGELLIARDGKFCFEALQARLHPAESYICRLAAQEPATLAAFDMLVGVDGRDLRDEPLESRQHALKAFLDLASSDRLIATDGTARRATAHGWLRRGAFEGVIAKRLDAPYAEGERAMIKVKRLRTADCVVGGFRYALRSQEVGSLLLGLFDDDGRLHHVGFTSGFATVGRAELTARLQALSGGAGFAVAPPGGPSRWSADRSTAWTPVRPELVVEVSFDHVSGGRFRHGTRLLRLRPDKSPSQCRLEQIAPVSS